MDDILLCVKRRAKNDFISQQRAVEAFCLAGGKEIHEKLEDLGSGMRTIKRKALPLNKNKWMAVQLLCQAYANEKNHWLDVLKEWKYQSLLGTPRKIRDELISHNYQSKVGLQARHWKLALQDAVETWDKNWKAQFVFVRSKIASHVKQEKERHTAYWLLKGYSQFAEMMQGKIPHPPHFEIDKNTCQRMVAYVQRQVKKHRPKQGWSKRLAASSSTPAVIQVLKRRESNILKSCL